MDWHELEKKKVTELREMAKEHTQLTGVSGMNKEHLVEALAHAMGIEKPHKVVHSAQKTKIKQEIRALKAERQDAIAKRDKATMESTREKIHRLRRKLRRMAVVGT